MLDAKAPRGHTTDMTHETITCRTRTGKKIHKAHPTSSVTFCGHWLKVQAFTMKVDITEAELAKANLIKCEHCFSPEERLVPNAAVTNPREMTFAQIRESGLTEGTDLRSQDARHRASYLLRTMSTAERFSYLSVEFPPRLQRLYNQIMDQLTAVGA